MQCFHYHCTVVQLKGADWFTRLPVSSNALRMYLKNKTQRSLWSTFGRIWSIMHLMLWMMLVFPSTVENENILKNTCVTSLEILTKNTKKKEKLVKKVEMSRMTVYASLWWKSRGINNNICDQLRWRQIWWINHNVHESNDLTWLMTKEAGTSDVFGVTWRVVNCCTLAGGGARFLLHVVMVLHGCSL